MPFTFSRRQGTPGVKPIFIGGSHSLLPHCDKHLYYVWQIPGHLVVGQAFTAYSTQQETCFDIERQNVKKRFCLLKYGVKRAEVERGLYEVTQASRYYLGRYVSRSTNVGVLCGHLPFL